MAYKNAKDVLPKKLLKELQKHIQGELIYIPRGKNNRVAWGENNGARRAINKRNENILKLAEEGHMIEDIMKTYSLSEASIKKIILKMRN